MIPRAAIALLGFLGFAACAPVAYPDFPPPDAWGGTSGPGGPAVSFTADQLQQPCALLDGGEQDEDHHNLVVMHDGYLVFPWIPEWGGGGLSFVDVSDPCAPVTVGSTFSETARESHNIGFARIDGRDWAVINDLSGVQFWDISDAANPQVVSVLPLPGVEYPDAYIRVVLGVFWQGPWVYAAAGFNGVFVIDASDPANPVHVTTYEPEINLGVGTLHAIGTLGMVSSAGGAATQLVDLSDPLDIRVRPGGEFLVHSSEDVPRAYYFANVGGPWGLFARNEATGGPILYDITDPSNPTFVSDVITPDGNGGYVFLKEDELWIGDSEDARVYDISDPTAPVELGVMDIPGDLDTATPIGNVAVLAADEGAADGEATQIFPWAAEPDRRAPRVLFHWPKDGMVNRSPGSKIGLSFDEMVEPKSVFAGSFRVYDENGNIVPGAFNTQESLVNFTPAEPLLEDTTYVVDIPAGGIVDYSGNAIAEEVSFRFSTGSSLRDGPVRSVGR